MKKPAKKKPNPFEIHINKQKMTILGRKTKNDRGLPGVSRAKAIKKRKETLLQEYKLQNKSNKFTDRRIGERSKDLSADDKTMARFAAIRKKAHKKSIYNLADDEVLTHKGQTLGEIEKFDDPRSEDDDDSLDEDKSGKLDSAFVGDAHFGGGILKRIGKDGAKTHRELIDELIAESKKRKAEKQKTKEATLELTEKLDTEWKDLLPLVNTKARKEQTDAAPLDEYDKVMRELRFEARGTVSDRLKTEDEVAREEKEKLEELEAERQKRMRGFEESDKAKPHRSADDLDDDFVYESDPEYMLSYNKDGEANVEVDAQLNGKTIGEKRDAEGSDCDEQDEEETQAESESEADAESEDDLSDLKAESSDEEEEDVKATTDEDEEDKSEQELHTETKKDEDKQDADTVGDELPYTFALPDTYDDLQRLLENQTSVHQAVIIERMIKCNHPSLAASNKENLGTLFVYLLQHLNDCASSVDEIFETFASLAPQLFELAQLDKENAQNSVKEVIKEKYEDFKIRRTQKRFTNPGLDVLIFFKLVSVLFPTSDFRHSVVTPCFVFIEQLLHKCRVESKRDIAFSLFLVTLVLEYTSLSKRYLPAAINYLGGVLHMAIPTFGVKLIKVNPPFKSICSMLVLVNDCTSSKIQDLKMQTTDLVEDDIDDSFKIRSLYTTLKLIQEFDDNFSELASNIEIFKDIFVYLELLPIRNYPKEVRTLFENVSQQLKNRKVEKKLEYIVMAAKKPKALRLYEPKFAEVFDGKRYRVQSKEKAERAKLLHKLKKETKGALREIRRDTSFLGRVKVKQRIESDRVRMDKVKRIYSEAAVQQSELNSLDRKKKKQ